MSWDDAERFCQSEGGHLASVNSSAIEDYLTKGMANRGYDSAWFGGNDMDKEGTWKWADCIPWKFTFWTKIPGHPGQPDNYGGGQNCLSHDLPKWGWDDGTCSDEKWFVCSKKICPGNIRTFDHFQSFMEIFSIDQQSFC